MKNSETSTKYTCNEYREEMILLALQSKLASNSLTSDEKREVIEQIEQLEKQMGID